MRYLISFLFLITLTISLACAKQATEIAVNTPAAVPAQPSQSTPTASPTPVDDAPRITLDEAKKLYDENKAFIVDARPEEAYKQEHIKGSVNITSGMLDSRLKDLPKDKTIIVYCSWPSEHTSASLVSQMKQKGITNAAALVGGTAAWKGQKYPMEGEDVKKQ